MTAKRDPKGIRVSGSGDSELDQMIAILEGVEKLAAGPVMAAALQEHAQTTLAAQTDAAGKAWPERRTRGSGPMLAGAGAAVSVHSTPTKAVIVLTGERHVRHHRGWVKGGHEGTLRRRIIPTTAVLPPALSALIVRKLQAKFTEIVGKHVSP